MPHRSPLEGVIDFSPSTPVFDSENARQHAENLFTTLLAQLAGEPHLATPFRRAEMVRLMHDYACSPTSKDLFLQSFFRSVQVAMTADLANVDLDPVVSRVVDFIDYLVAKFFLPLRASSARTPQPTPASLSVPSLAPNEVLPGSAARLANLRRDCFIRDKHRCVVSRKFDRQEAFVRWQKDGDDAADDDGIPFREITGFRVQTLQVAHILPHSLMSIDGTDEVSTARRNALAILDMFDVGVRHLIGGPAIDRPTNAITLTAELHSVFGAFHSFFEPVAGAPHTYRVDSVLPVMLREPPQPVTRTLFVSDTIDPPLPRLLAIHAAICRILHMTGAGYHCDNILREAEEHMAKADGSTNLGTLAALRLAGWWDGVAA